MKKNIQIKKKQQDHRPIVIGYNETLQAIVLRIVNPKGMYPCYLQDPEAGLYKIIKTRAGKLQMSK